MEAHLNRRGAETQRVDGDQTSEIEHIREEPLRKEFEGAARDPLFCEDMAEISVAFEAADSETARMIPDD